MSTPTPEDRARQIHLGNGGCGCSYSSGPLCFAHQQIAGAIRAAEDLAAQHALAAETGDLPRQLLALVREVWTNRTDWDIADVLADYLEENGRDAAGHRVRLLRPQTGDVLVWTYPMAGIAQTAGDMIDSVQRRIEAEHAAHAIQNDLKRLGRDVAVAVHSDHAGLEVVQSEDMRRQGWVPAEEAERLRAMVREENFRREQEV